MMSTGPARPALTGRRGELRRRLLAVAGAAAADVAVWAVAARFAGLDVRLGAGHAAGHVGPVIVAVVSVAAGLAGWALLSLLEKLAPRHARRAWTITALAVLVVSLAGPLSAGITMGTRLALACLHLAAAMVLIPALAGTARTPARGPGSERAWPGSGPRVSAREAGRTSKTGR
jgi:hypothetical protein